MTSLNNGNTPSVYWSGGYLATRGLNTLPPAVDPPTLLPKAVHQQDQHHCSHHSLLQSCFTREEGYEGLIHAFSRTIKTLLLAQAQDRLLREGIPFSEEVITDELSTHFRTPSHLPTYNGTNNPLEHLNKFEDVMLPSHIGIPYTNGFKYRVFFPT
ncbi:UNVERIFIED_CONTAM: hypothetical protein Sradi_0387500 [Sesamum radiatum]|uniref:Uncharacterized protein n=1 Tax=Sesamum radiatum TaxID=300843 RepID=A0AAW2W9I0_SESRA